MHISRYTNSYWDRNKDWKLREIENASEMQIPGSDHEILTVGIEDILATKADRINQLEEKGYVDGKYREHWKEFLSGNLERLKESDDIYREKGRIDGMRNALSLIPKEKFRENIDKVNRYKVKKDIYDMKILLNEKDIEKEIDKAYLAFATKEQGVENEII
ncbi:MAG: hypothetical protein MUP58_01800 [Candidatus Nanohaloarchaeota archaeon QJJ-9]|nr:hypothetical protein [Candidatus Nanohaloarchaeota archaeon QJJ-9]